MASCGRWRSVSGSTAINTYDVQLTQIDTLGPQVFDPDGAGPNQAIQIVGNPTFNLFATKPANAAAGPTPAVNGLTINFRDPINATQIGSAPGAAAVDALADGLPLGNDVLPIPIFSRDDAGRVVEVQPGTMEALPIRR